MPGAPAKGTSSSFTLSKRIGTAKAKEISTVEDFVVGYRNREDTSLLKSQTLVAGSYNVLSDVSGRIKSRKGYTLDGAISSVVSPIRAPYDWEPSSGITQHLRAGFITSAGNDGKVQIRYQNSSGTVSWLDLLTGLTSTFFNYAPYWDNTALVSKLLMVNGGTGIWEWRGAFASVSATTATSITISGNQTFAQLGFPYSNGTLGDNTTGYTLSIPVAGTKRYTYVSTGTNPNITSTTMPIGTRLTIPTGPDAGSSIPITNIGTNFFEFATSNVTTGNFTIGQITYDGGYSHTLIAGGTTYTYTAGAQTNTILGVTPTAASISVGTPIYDSPVFTSNGSMTDAPTGIWTNDFICMGGPNNNQVFLASKGANLVYVSKSNNYKDYSYTIPVRIAGEGALFITDGPIRCLIDQEDAVYVSAGIDEWYESQFVATTIVDSTTGTQYVTETASLPRLKTASQQASISQYATSKIQNNVIYISNEPILYSLGRVTNILLTPQLTDLSFPIVNDMNAYDFTDASLFYFKQFVYMAVPKENLFRIYNMTNPKNPYWEAPQLIALSGFSSVGNILLGHSYQTSESYVLFNGNADRSTTPDNGNPIAANAIFAYQTEGIRPKSKSFNKFWIEGYMSPNTVIKVGLTYRGGAPGNSGQAINQTLTVYGNGGYVLTGNNDDSLGKFPLGSVPLGGDPTFTQANSLPPYFAVIPTFPRIPYFAYQPSFYSYGIGQDWEILSFGNNAAPTSENEANIQI